jgi:hypothetical protein
MARPAVHLPIFSWNLSLYEPSLEQPQSVATNRAVLGISYRADSYRRSKYICDVSGVSFEVYSWLSDCRPSILSFFAPDVVFSHNVMTRDAQDWPVIDAKLLHAPGAHTELTPRNLPLSIFEALRGNPGAVPADEASDWMRWLDVLSAHRVLPLLYRHVVRGGFAPSLPAGVMAHIKNAYMTSWAGSARLERELGFIATVFGRGKIPFLVLKGPAFSRTIYEDPAMRPFDDLDLLVNAKDFRRARSLLKSIGYRATTGLGLEHHQEFLKEEKGYEHRVELHRTLNIFPRIGWGLPVREVFEKAIEVKAEGCTFRTLDPIHAFLHSALHIFTHHREEIRLIWIHDLAQMAERFSGDDWKELHQASVIWMARLAVEEGLTMARAWFDTVAPVPFSNFACWPAPTNEELALWESLGVQGSMSGLLKLYGSEHFGFLDKMFQVYYLVFPPAHVMAKRYPVSRQFLLPLAYARRWWALLIRSLS